MMTVHVLQIWDNADFGTVIAYAEMVTNFPEDVLMAFTGLDVVSQIQSWLLEPSRRRYCIWPAAVFYLHSDVHACLHLMLILG